MKIVKLGLIAFGPFDGIELDLNRGNHGFHIIYGLNEAGKSSALRALRSVFYGIPVRSADNFTHPYNQMRIGAEILHSDGTRLKFIRRKGSKNTLRTDNDENILDDAVLKYFLNGIDADRFSTMFGIDHGDLVEGGREIIKGGGNLGQIIFAAGSGITGLKNIQAELQESADDLFKPSGKNPRINQTIIRVKENRKNLRDIALASGDWDKHDKALCAALEKKQQTEQALTIALTEKNHLERIQQALPLIAKRRALMDDLKNYGSTVLLPENFSRQRRDHVSKLKIAQNDLAQANGDIHQLEEEINRFEISNRILQNTDKIESIYKELGGYVKAARDKNDLRARADILRSEAKQILHDLKDDITIEDADKLRLSKKDTLYIHELGSRYERIVTLMDNTREQIPLLEHQIAEINSRLAQHPASQDTEKLHLAIETAADYVSMEKQVLEALAESELSETALANELKRQSLWSGTLEGLEHLSIPSVETIDRFENDFDAINHAIAQTENEIKQLKTQLSETIKKTDALNLNFSVPTESELFSARKDRDSLWRMAAEIIEKPGDSETISNRFFRQFPEENSLAAAFETRQDVADQIADRLRREADRVAALAKLASDKSDFEKQLNSTNDEKKIWRTKHETISSKWAEQWAAADISPASPKEMRVWANRTMDITARYIEIRQQVARTKIKQKEIETVRNNLIRIFESFNESIPATDETLANIVKRGRKRIEQEKQILDQKEKILAEKTQKDALLSDLKIRYQTYEKELDRWQQVWEKAVAPLGLDADSVPTHANALLEDLKLLFDKLKESDVLKKRIEGIDRDAAVFGKRVKELVDHAARHLSGIPSDQAAAELVHLLNETKTAHSKVQTLENQLEKAALRRTRALTDIAAIEAFLETMCEEAGCSNYKDLPDAENRSVKRREVESELKTVELQLLKLSAGTSVDNFITECLAVEPDGIKANLENLLKDIERLSSERSDLDQTIGSERTELSKMDGSARAAALAEDTQILLGSLENDIENYARYKIAAAVLNMAIEKFRDKNQSPMLLAAGSFFSQITAGSFDSIRAEFDDAGNPVIAGIRNRGSEIIHVDGMSEGTADQLYLSLRLAGLSSYLEKNEPIPFIVDDILIKFDDIRARATLEVLAGLSEKTQIIFFTHHRHLMELAQTHIDPSILTVHHLSAG